MRFQISDKVICVDDSPPALGRGRLQRGGVYVVADCAAANEGGFWCRLAGHPREINIFGGEIGWDCERFRKLSDIEAEARGISMLDDERVSFRGFSMSVKQFKQLIENEQAACAAK